MRELSSNFAKLKVAHHVEVAVAEQVEAVAVDRRVNEFVLAEYIDGLVGNDRAGEQQAVFCLRAQPVQRPARGDVVGLDLVTLVADDAVRLPCSQLLLQAPRRFIIHHQHLQGGPVHVADGVGLARAAAREHSEVVAEGGEAFKLVLPYAEDGQRRDHQQVLDFSLQPQTADDGDGSQRLAGTHLHEQRRSAAGFQTLEREGGDFTLVLVWGCARGARARCADRPPLYRLRAVRDSPRGRGSAGQHR